MNVFSFYQMQELWIRFKMEIKYHSIDSGEKPTIPYTISDNSGGIIEVKSEDLIQTYEVKKTFGLAGKL